MSGVMEDESGVRKHSLRFWRVLKVQRWLVWSKRARDAFYLYLCFKSWGILWFGWIVLEYSSHLISSRLVSLLISHDNFAMNEN